MATDVRAEGGGRMPEWRSAPQVVATVRATCGKCGRRLEINVYRSGESALDSADRTLSAVVEKHRKRCGADS